MSKKLLLEISDSSHADLRRVCEEYRFDDEFLGDILNLKVVTASAVIRSAIREHCDKVLSGEHEGYSSKGNPGE